MSSGLAGETDDPAPSLSVSAKPVVSGAGSTITFSGSYADSVAIESVAVYSRDTLIGTATLDRTNQTWSLTATLGVGLYDSFSVVLIDIQDGSARANLPYSLQLGVTGQFYVTEETDLLDGVVVSKTFFRSDSSIYKIDTYDAGILIAENYYNVTGTNFTSYEIDYDAAGHVYCRKYYGYTDQKYVDMVQNFSFLPQSSTYKLDSVQYLNADGSLYEEILYKDDGGYSTVFYGITGRSYTSYEIDYDHLSHYTAYKYFGFTGQLYTSLERDYIWSSVSSSYTLLDALYLSSNGSVIEKIAYDADGSHVNTFYDIEGKPFTSREVDYDENNHYTSIKYFGYTGRSYASAQFDYIWSSTTSEYSPIDILFFGAGGSVVEKAVYGADGSHANTFYDIEGKPFTSREVDYDENNHYTSMKYFGYTGRSYASAQFDYIWSSTTSEYSPVDILFFDAGGSVVEKVVYGADGSHVNTFYDVEGMPFTTREVDYDTNNHFTSIKLFGYTDRFYASLQYDYEWSSTTSKEILVDALYFRSDGSLAEKIVYNPDGSHASALFGLAGQQHSS